MNSFNEDKTYRVEDTNDTFSEEMASPIVTGLYTTMNMK